MRPLCRLLRRLWETPGAEVDPDAWATRFAAHMGLSAGVMIALLAAASVAADAVLWLGWALAVPLPGGLHGMAVLAALAVSMLGYAAWEWSQWRRARGWLLAWDCVLDWCAWAAMAFAIAAEGATAAAYMLTALVICAAGVWRRS